jgi:hypothetical protein
MRTRRLLPLTALALLLPAARIFAGDATGPAPRDGIVLRRVEAAAPAPGSIGTESANATFSYSVELPQVARLQGAGAFYRTAVDITNHSDNGGVTATVQFSYNCAAPASCVGGGFFRTSPKVYQLAARDSIHFDDMVQELDDQALLTTGAVNGAVGGLLVRFDGLPSTIGWEGSAVARLYTRIDENNPALGTIGYAFPASLFFESAYETAVGIARDTTPDALANNTQGSQRTNIGVRNTDVHAPPGSNRPIDLDVSFYDPATGNKVGNDLVTQAILPGEVRIFGNVFSAAHIPATISQVLVFVDATTPIVLPPANPPSPTFEAFIITIDNVTQDGSYFDMKCGDTHVPTTCGQ